MSYIANAERLRNIMNTAGTYLTDEQALTVPYIYPPWSVGTLYTVGDRVMWADKLHKCLTTHSSQADWTPTAAPSLWAEVLAGQSGTEIGEWAQPESTNPYMTGDRVTHNGKTWVCAVDNNVWEPGVYGWNEE